MIWNGSKRTGHRRTVFWSCFFSFQMFASKMHFILHEWNGVKKCSLLKRASGDLYFRAVFCVFRHVQAKCTWFSIIWNGVKRCLNVSHETCILELVLRFHTSTTILPKCFSQVLKHVTNQFLNFSGMYQKDEFHSKWFHKKVLK